MRAFIVILGAGTLATWRLLQRQRQLRLLRFHRRSLASEAGGTEADPGATNQDTPFLHDGASGTPQLQPDLPANPPSLLPHFPAATTSSFGSHAYHVHLTCHALAPPPPAPSHPHHQAIQELLHACNPTPGQGTAVSAVACSPMTAQTVSSAVTQSLPGWSMPLPPIPPLPPALERSPCIMVTTPRQLKRLGEHLMQVSEFAVDTEHHAEYSYLGVTCLIQISTGSCDWLVDTLRLWRLVGPTLRPVFASPHIVKVLHGCSNDVLWLQRDFHLYLVNVFDTERAAAALGFPSRSLASLLQSLCGVTTDKSYQRADWRTRPLTQAMAVYARTDVHYLGHIAAQLRHRLSQAASTNPVPAASVPLALPPALSAVLQRSQLLTLQLYTKRGHVEEVAAAASQLTRRALGAVGVTAVGGALQQTATAQLAAVQQLAPQLATTQQTARPQLAVQPATPPLADVQQAATQLAAVQAATLQLGAMVLVPPDVAAISQAAAAEVMPDHAQQGQAAAGAALPQATMSQQVAAGYASREQDRLLQLAVSAQVEGLCCWRDITARAEDVSPQVVLEDSVLLALVLAQPQGVHQVLELLQLHGGWQGQGHLARHEAARGEGDASLGRSRRRWWWRTEERPGPHIQSQEDKASSIHELLVNAASRAAPGLNMPSPLTTTTTASSASATGGEGGGGGATAGQQRAGGLALLDPERRERFIRNFSSKTEVYQNCMMMSLEGQLLCHCDKRKLEWYVAKGLAERINDDPPTIRLLFEHKNTDQIAGEQFYSQSKLNRCVVCGDESHYLRYRVVPSCYRRHFPVAMKSHRSHDVVLICIACHQTAHGVAESTKRQVAAEYNVPLNMPPGATQPSATPTPGMPPGATQLPTTTNGLQPSATPNVLQYPATPSEAQPSATPTPGVAVGGAPAQNGAHFPPTDTPLLNGVGGGIVSEGGGVAGEGGSSGESNDEEEDEQEEEEQGGQGKGEIMGSRAMGSSKGNKGGGAGMGGGDGPRAGGGGKDGGGGKGSEGSEGGKGGSGAARSAATALRKAGSKLPAVRRAALEETIKRALGRDPAAEEPGLRVGDLEAASVLGLSTRKRAQVLAGLPPDVAQAAEAIVQAAAVKGEEGATGGGHTWHGQHIVEAALGRGGEEELHKLVARFRAAFVSGCHPRFLPPSWDVQHKAQRQYGEHSVFAQNRLPPEPPARGKDGDADGGALPPELLTRGRMDGALSPELSSRGKDEDGGVALTL